MSYVKWGVFAVSVAMSFTTIALAQNSITSVERTQGMAMIKAAGTRLADKLKDPDSARFRQVVIRKVSRKDGTVVIDVCGQVNAKNGYGGFSGWTAFESEGNSVLMDGELATISIAEICEATQNAVGEKYTIDAKDYALELKTAFQNSAGR